MELRGGNQFLSPQLLMSAVGLFEGKKIGYLGCGSSGHFTVAFAQAAGVTGKVYAVDILQSALDSTMRAIARFNLTNVQPVQANLEVPGSASIPAASLDQAFLINMLFQNANREAVVTEAIRLLKPGGKLVIVDWRPGATAIGPADQYRISPDTVRQLGLRAGLELFKEGGVGDYHYLFIFKKVK